MILKIIFIFIIVLLLVFATRDMRILNRFDTMFAKGSPESDKKDIGLEDGYAFERVQMVEHQIKDRGIKDPLVLKAMETVPRHEFVPKEFKKYSYSDQPLPIGLDQTISQPYIVAFMTEQLELDEDDIVLEIGTGSGYQAAVISLIAKQIYTIEILESLGKQVRDTLRRLGYNNIEVKIGDGYNGWLEHAPYDAIIGTAAPNHIPSELINQLKKGGRMIIPVGGIYYGQNLKLIKKDDNGNIAIETVLPVRFVPMTRR